MIFGFTDLRLQVYSDCIADDKNHLKKHCRSAVKVSQKSV